MTSPIIDVNTIFGFWPFREIDISAKALVEIMRVHKVLRACSLSTKGIFYDFHLGNEETWKVSQTYPKIIPVATFDFSRYLGIKDEIRQRLNQGFKLFRLLPDYQCWKIDDLRFQKVLPLFEEIAAPVIIGMQNSRLSTLSKIAAGFSFPIILEGVSFYDTGEILEIMGQHPNFYVETHWLNGPDTVEILVNHFGPQRLIFGSNSPLFYMGGAIERIKNADITEHQKELIFGKNLMSLLGE